MTYPEKPSIRRELLAVKGFIMSNDGPGLPSGPQRLHAEYNALKSLFYPFGNSINWQGAATLVLLAAWCIIWVGSFYTSNDLPIFFIPVTGFLMLIIGRWWGINVAFAGLELTMSDSDDE